jgi:hypothetical protein
LHRGIVESGSNSRVELPVRRIQPT